jgi:citrate lyase subunit beta / citryl-CoA lyase
MVRGRSLRRSKLIVPGDRWDLIGKAQVSGADIVHLDLEDGVAPNNKDRARETVSRALRELDWSRQEAWVRIEHFDAERTLLDLKAILEFQPQLVYMAKVKQPDEMRRLDALVSAEEAAHGLQKGSIQIGAVIERILALHHVEAIAAATPRMGAIVFGVADMSNEFGYRPSHLPGADYETLYIRSRLILAARLAGIDVIDAPFVLFRDLEASEVDAKFSARLGFSGKSAISPRQIPGIHRAFSPTRKELAWAREVMKAWQAMDATGQAVAVIDGEMVDKPHFIRAERILSQAAPDE